MNKEEKITFGINEDTKGIDLYHFIIYNMKFNEVIDLFTLLKSRIENSCCDVRKGDNYEK